MKKDFRKKVKIFVPLIIFVIGIVYSISIIYNIYNRPKISNKAKKIIEQVKENNNDNVINDETKQENIISEEPYINKLPEYRNQYGNGYIMGNLNIPGIEINSLVTRAKNNIYYLNHNIYNKYDELGTPFFDYRNQNLLYDLQINIYGHNTQNEKYYDKLPFSNLDAYTDQNVFNTYKDINLEIDEAKLKYRVIAIKIINNSDNEHMKLVFTDEEDYLNHINKLLSNTLYNDNVEYNANDKFLVLQACHFNPVNSYVLVIAKRIA